MPDFVQTLHQSTEALYTVFAPYRTQVMVSKTQDTRAIDPVILDTALSDLTVSQLTSVIKRLNDYQEADRVLRRFLPRILELSITGYNRWSVGLDRIFASYSQHNWQTWPAEEVSAIHAFLHAWWQHHLHDVLPSGTTSSADTILEAVAHITDIQPFLQVWSDLSHQVATAHIASMTVYGKKHLRVVRHWLAQPAIIERIEAAFWDCRDHEDAAMFAQAAEYLHLNDTPIPA